MPLSILDILLIAGGFTLIVFIIWFGVGLYRYYKLIREWEREGSDE